MRKKSNNVLVIPDLHIPYHHENAFEFIMQTKKKYNCNTVISIGDIVDQYYFSSYEHDCGAEGLQGEMIRARFEIRKWAKAFPRLTITYGNHDLRIMRKARKAGIPVSMLKNFNAIYGTPKGWNWVHSTEIDGVLYVHGDGVSGNFGHLKMCERNRQSCVIGHLHKGAGVSFSACYKDLIFGMNVGCLIDNKAFAFDYAKTCLQKPVLGCGVVLENGKYPHFEPMVL